MAYIGKSPAGLGVRARYFYTATGGETSLSGADDNGRTLQFTDGEYVDVYLNGVLLVAGTDYGTGTANTISGLDALSAGNIVEIVAYDIFSLGKANTEALRRRYYKTATGGETSISGSDDNGLTITFAANAEIEVYLNGVALVQGDDYNTSTANTVGGLSALDASDIVSIVVYEEFILGDVVSKKSGGIFGNSISVSGDLTVDTNTLVVDSTNNRVGIGTSSPSNPLTINSADENHILLENGSEAANIQLRDSGNMEIIYKGSGNKLKFMHDSTERMRIDDSGNVGIGTSSPSQKLDVGGAGARIYLNDANEDIDMNSAADGQLRLDGSGYAGAIALNTAGMNIYTNSSSRDIIFGVNETERMRIDGSGNVLVGKTSVEYTSVGFALRERGELYATANGLTPLLLNRLTSNGAIASFRRSGSTVGTISVTGSSTAYNTSSDYRLKENVTGITGGIERVKQLNPSRFNFISDASTTVDGFLAHEAATVVPEAVTGTHNEVDGDGNPVYQGIDQAKLVPLLTAALQEAITKIETLETRIAALEAE